MAAPVPPGAPRPGSNAPPPNYVPNFRGSSDGLADNMQNLNLNRPPMTSNPVSRPPSFGQQPGQQQPFPSSGPLPQGFPGSSPPFSRPGPPPGTMGRPGGPPSGPSVGSLGRPTGPPPGQPSPFGARPTPPGSFSSPLGNVGPPVSGVPPPGGSPPVRPSGPPTQNFGARPRPSPFSSPPMSAPPGMPPTSAPINLMSNGPPVFSGGAMPVPQHFQGGSVQQPPVGPPTMRVPPGPPGHPQSPYSMAPQGIMQPPSSPFAAPSWQTQAQQVVPPPPVPGNSQPPRMFGMPPPLPNQSMTTTISPAVGQTGAPMAGPSKIDPNQIPRPTPGSTVIMHDTRQGNQATIPPPATSDFIVRDTGNCSPRYMKCTINQIPFTADLLTTSGMQLAMLVQPLALPHPSEDPIQVVDFGESGPVRCSRCKAYVNPFMKFIDQGRRFICNLCAFLAMKDTGGKLMVFQSVLPSIGIGALSAREAEGRTNISAGEKEAHKLLQPSDKTLKDLAVELAEYQVCVDVFVTTQTYVDIASISAIPRTTGGQVYYYYPFSALSDPAKLYNDLRWNVTRPQGFEAVMRVRCSQGIQVQEYYGNFCKRIPTDVDLPGIDCDKTFMVTLKHDDKLQDGSECAFQCALLYTTVYGQRRIRVITLSLPVTSMLSNLFRAADLDTQFCCFLKQAASEIPSKPLPLVREQVTNLCTNALYSYRKFCATVSSSGQLILPEALKLLPLYTLALTKSTGLRTDGKIDERSFWINYVSSLSAPLAIPLVYPRMVAIHDLDSKEEEESVVPSFLPLSSEHISDDGIYLLENGHDCLIYAGESVNPDIVRKLFGVSTVDEIPTHFVLQQFDNPLSKKLNEVVNEIRRQRFCYLRLKLCRKGDPSGMLFFSYMIEDKSAGGFSYVEFLIHVHRQIQNKMAS
ncbi:hypothetical protein RYX36_021622 [Vicia faba]